MKGSKIRIGRTTAVRIGAVALCLFAVVGGAPAMAESSAGGATAAAVPAADTQPAGAAQAASTAPGQLKEWNTFLANRTDYLYSLSVPVLACTQTRGVVNLASPLFHGCYDWHSGVHAYYALYDIARHAGNDIFTVAANNQLDPALIPAELQYMRFAVVHDNSDNPYGFSWLLLVDRERELTTGDTALRPLADFAAQQILVDLHALDKATAEARIASTEYVNLSWTILTLNAWAKFTNNATYQAAVDQATNDWLMDPAVDAMCPFAKDTAPNATGFFAPCLLRLATVVDVKGPEAARSWVTQRLPSTLDIQPITSPNGIHAHSLNFSRAVGLWGIFVTTGDTRYQEAFAQLMNYQMAHPDIWRTNYANYAHWVAQFGVLAIDRTYAQFPG